MLKTRDSSKKQVYSGRSAAYCLYNCLSTNCFTFKAILIATNVRTLDENKRRTLGILGHRCVNSLKRSGYYIHHMLLTLKLCNMPIECIYVLRMILRTNSYYSLYSTNQLSFVIETHCVFRTEEIELLSIIHRNMRLQSFKPLQ
jgi:hypothetical protein